MSINEKRDSLRLQQFIQSYRNEISNTDTELTEFFTLTLIINYSCKQQRT